MTKHVDEENGNDDNTENEKNGAENNSNDLSPGFLAVELEIYHGWYHDHDVRFQDNRNDLTIKQSTYQFLGVVPPATQPLAFTLAKQLRKWILNENLSEVNPYEKDNGARVSNQVVALIAKVLPLRRHLLIEIYQVRLCVKLLVI